MQFILIKCVFSYLIIRNVDCQQLELKPVIVIVVVTSGYRFIVELILHNT